MLDYFDISKMFTYIKAYAKGKGWNQTLHALMYARKLHEGQFRKSGEPYIIHPLIMANHAISLGINEDNIIASILLHDVVEDCDVSVNDLPCDEDVRHAVDLLTYRKPSKWLERDGQGVSIVTVKAQYYQEIAKNKYASIAKLFDRCHNVSTMAGAFTKEKLVEYIDETKTYVFPLLRSTKDQFVEYSDQIFVLKYHIISVLDTIKGVASTYDIII